MWIQVAQDGAHVCAQLGAHVGAQVGAHVGAQVGAQVWTQVWHEKAHVCKQVWQVGLHVTHVGLRTVGEHPFRHVTPVGNAAIAGWACAWAAGQTFAARVCA